MLRGNLQIHHSLQISLLQLTVQVGSWHGLDSGMKVGKLGPKGFQRRDEEAQKGGAAAAQWEHLKLLALGLLKAALGPVGKKDHLPGVIQQGKTLGGELHRAGGALKQHCVQLPLQRVDLLSHRGLGHVEAFRGPGEIQRFRHGQKTGELESVQNGFPLLLINISYYLS